MNGIDLSGVDLRGVNMTSANLSGLLLHEANFRGADLRGANLRGALLIQADFTRAMLYGADFSATVLFQADFHGSVLGPANLTDAELSDTTFSDTHLGRVKGLETCIHDGPSTLDYRTLTRSGQLPLPFLRGCGLPDSLIDYLPSLFSAGAIQFYSCFISYATEDQAFAERLHADLQSKGVRCWFAPHDMQGGKKIHEQIDEAIRVYDRLLLIVSNASMTSRWVKTEIARARHQEASQGRRVLFPVSLVPFKEIQRWEQFDADIGDDSAKEIREFYVPDFSGWQHQAAYQRAFERLLKDLKAEAQTDPQRLPPE
jgi:uncharacterized protein YjbI with pentapeptide repeats